MKKALKSVLFLILVPAVFIGVIPFVFLQSGAEINTSIFFFLALPMWMFGGMMILLCFWDFLVKGKGTPAPIDPPKELVITGLYRYIRNPMYAGVLLMLFSEFLWLGYLNMLFYALFFFAAFHLFIIFYEEPTLKKSFGDHYRFYLNTVPRWIPRFGRGK